jgi:hypothetical protein
MLEGHALASDPGCDALVNRLLPGSPCHSPASVYAATQFASGAGMIRIRATDDGTYTVFRDDAILVRGLTRDQANAVAQSLKVTFIG